MKQRYDSYKPSGIDWIGDIPEHWIIAPFKRSLRINNGCDYKHIVSEYGYPVIGSGGQFAFASDYLYDGEVLLLGRKGTIDRPMHYNGKFWTVDTMFYAIPNNNVCCKYMYYQALGFPFDYYSTATALPSMAASDLANNPIIVPPLSEQQAIALWLDARCGEIDAAIAKVDREIELIDELKQSEISRVVTRGLNPDAPLRPSGIDWIGDIPSHWKIENGKFLLHILPGFPADSNLFVKEDNGFPLIRIRDIDSYTTEINYSGEVPEDYIIIKGDILVGMDGDFNIAQWKGPNALLNQRVCKISGTNKFIREYAFYVLPKLLKRINDVTYATTVKHLSTYDISNSKLPVPPLSEQQAIADYLDKKCAEIDGLKAKLSRKHETLTELRQSIISEVVTGKRKVI